jgi:hypothetical protein
MMMHASSSLWWLLDAASPIGGESSISSFCWFSQRKGKDSSASILHVAFSIFVDALSIAASTNLIPAAWDDIQSL